jgi:predicted permease
MFACSMEAIRADLKFVLRSLSKSPLFVAVAVASLALGIGANSAIFSLLDQVLLRSLPVKEPKQLVLVDWDGAFSGRAENDHAFSYPMYADFRDKNPGVFQGLLAHFPTSLDVRWKGSAERANGELVSGNYFEVLGVGTAIGRTLTPDDDKIKGAAPYAVLSYGYWQRRFGGSTAILNQTIGINDHPMTVVGVAERGFKGTDVGAAPDVFVPMMMKAQVTPTWDDLENRRSIWLNIIGRLRPDVPIEQARAAMTVIYHQELAEELKTMPEATNSFRKRFLANKLLLKDAAKGVSELRNRFSTPLVVLMAMVGTLLLIACTNVANLLVARAATRQREIAIRLSLGASNGAIIRLVMTESLLLSFAGGMFGLLIASWTGSLLIRILPFQDAAQVFTTTPDLRVLLFTFGLSALTALLFGLIPALQSTRPELAPTLKSEATSLIGSGHVKLRKGMVAAQIALSLLLLVGAGLFSHSLHNLMTSDPGMRTDHVLEFTIDPSLAGYSSARIRQIVRELHNQLVSMPGVEQAAGAENALLSRNNWMATTRAEGYTAKEGENLNPNINGVLPGFFSTMGIPLIAGREFNDRDQFGAPKVAIVNQAFANFFFHHESPIGRHIGFGNPATAKLEMEIVGVVKDAKGVDLKESTARYVFIPALQNEHPNEITFYLRTRNDPKDIMDGVRRSVRQLDSALPIYNIKALVTQINETHYTDRLIAFLSAAFGLLATMLASIGLYGVMAFTVARRTREIGIRMALGAQRNAVLWIVMQEVLLLTGLGMAAGLPSAFALGRLVEDQLFLLKAHDPVTLICATLVLAIVSAIAGYLPAYRATRIDPMQALRWE